MRLLINASGNNDEGGPLQVMISFINECKKFSDIDFQILTNPNVLSQLDQKSFPENFTFHNIPKQKIIRIHSYLKKIEKKIKPDVVFTVFGQAYWRPKAPHLVGFAQGYYVYPESPFWKRLPFRKYVLLKLKQFIHICYYKRDADAIVCETPHVTQKAEELIGKKKQYFTVSNTCSSLFFEPVKTGKQKLPPKSENEFRLLSVSKYRPHKNIEIAGQVIDVLEEKNIHNIKFIFTITDQEYNSAFEKKYQDKILNVGTIPVNESPALYQECDGVFLPTLVECFSASYPEAMASKKIIFSSDMQFAKDICKDSAIYFDPLNPKDIAEKIVQTISDPPLIKRKTDEAFDLVKKLPTAESRAKAYIDICKSLIRKK